MTGNPFITSSAHHNKITQADFYTLYLQSLDCPDYRPVVDSRSQFYLAKLLIDKGYALDLSHLNLRNLDFTSADFTGINLKHADLRGAILNFADLRGATNISIKIDLNTKYYGAKLMPNQLVEIQAGNRKATEQDLSFAPNFTPVME